MTLHAEKLVGKRVLRLEDPALLRGRARFVDDLPVKPGTLHAAILRSPHAHAEIISIDASKALRAPGVAAVITRDDVLALTDPFIIGLTTPLEYRCLATDRVRFVGEPVAVVLASDRYLAEDALELISIEYRPLPAVIDPVAAARPDAPVLHPKVGSNIIVSRDYAHGDVAGAFARAAHRSAMTVHFPRNSIPPMEGFAVLAEYLCEEDGYDTLSNFQGPFSLHTVMARALQVPSNRLRIRTAPNSGGAFGVKLVMYAPIVLTCLASRVSGHPVKWIEDRLEHLAAANSMANRTCEVEAAYNEDGRVLAIRYHHWDDHGAYLRAPMPAPTIRAHAFCTGVYAIPAVQERIDVVATNKTPTGAVRGFGAPHIHFALERMMHQIAVELGRDPLDIMRRNLIPAEAFPYKAPGGGLYDSGNYQAAIDEAIERGGLTELKRRRDDARAQGRLYGIGYAAVIDPGQSNMGYIATVKTPEERRTIGPKNGAIGTATVAVDPLGAVTVAGDSVPQGQGHRTVLAQVVAQRLGLVPEEIAVNLELDTQKDGWSIAAGNYACRFGPICTTVADMAAAKIRDKLARIAASRLNVPASELEFAGGRIFARSNPQNSVSFHRVAGEAHWSPGTLPPDLAPGLRETVQWSPPQLTPTTEDNQINSMAVYGFGFDFCGVEIDRDTGEIRVDKYVTIHDCGPLLNPGIAEGQIGGSFAYGLNTALYEEFVYGEDGSFLSGTYADYLVGTAHEIPRFASFQPSKPTASPWTAFGAKGISEGNTTSTPVCIANAVANALGRSDIRLPLRPARVAEWLHGAEQQPRATVAQPRTTRALTGSGSAVVPEARERVFQMLLDPSVLRRIIPGCHALDMVGANSYRADVSLGAGPVRGRFDANVRLHDLSSPHRATIEGRILGSLGTAHGTGHVRLSEIPEGTRADYDYAITVSGKIAAIGGRMVDGAARALIGVFFRQLVAAASSRLPWWRRLLLSARSLPRLRHKDASAPPAPPRHRR
jgi:2-furoyl-CoA dehydrogenase large subunit